MNKKQIFARVVRISRTIDRDFCVPGRFSATPTSVNLEADRRYRSP